MRTFLLIALALSVAFLSGPLNATVLDDLDDANTPPTGWTNFQAGWGGQATATGGVTHLTRTCVYVDLAGNDGSSGIVRGFPINPSSTGEAIVDMAVPSGLGAHWIETAWSVYDTDPGAAQAGSDFDAMDGSGGGTGLNANWALLVKFDSWGMGTDNNDTWTTYSTSDNLGNTLCGGGFCPASSIGTTGGSASVIYFGFKVGNFGEAYYDNLIMDNVLPVEDWMLY